MHKDYRIQQGIITSCLREMSSYCRLQPGIEKNKMFNKIYKLVFENIILYRSYSRENWTFIRCSLNYLISRCKQSELKIIKFR